jgi:hypothetical protein
VRLNDKALTIATGLVLLLGVGTFVHKGDELFGPKTSTTQIAKAQVGPVVQTDALPDSYRRESIPAPDTTTVVASLPASKSSDISDFAFLRGTQTASVTPLSKPDTFLKIDPLQMECALNLSAKPLRGARVLLEVVAPCHKNKVVTISHAGLRFTEIVDDRGMISIIIPVLSDPANIEVSFADGVSKSISASAKDLSALQRIGIAWSGQADLQLQAVESSYNSTQNRHITALNAGSYKQAYLQGGGYLTTLGNKDIEGGKFIQIYSVEKPNDVFVDFQVVLDDPRNLCGTNLAIGTVRFDADLGAQIASKNVSVRNCSAENQTIVLKNMLRNLIVAQQNQ